MLTFILHSLILFVCLLALVWFARRDAVRSYRRKLVEPLIKRNHLLVDFGSRLVDDLHDQRKENLRLQQNLKAALSANNSQQIAHRARIEFLRERVSYLAQRGDELAAENAQFQAQLRKAIVKGQRTR